MYLLNSQQIKDLELYTIKKQKIKTIDLIGNAARACFQFIAKKYDLKQSFLILAGKGNNGSDGWALGYLLHQNGYKVMMTHLAGSGQPSKDNLYYQHQWNQSKIGSVQLDKLEDIKRINLKSMIVIDALFGIGLNKKIEGLTRAIIEYINSLDLEVIAIDIPSGLSIDKPVLPDDSIVKATHTLSFQSPKLNFLFAENKDYVGTMHLLNVSLEPPYLLWQDIQYEYITPDTISHCFKFNSPFTHKGMMGRALLVGGMKSKLGAIMLSAMACLRSGVGLLDLYVPQCAYDILQSTVYEAMIHCNKGNLFLQDDDIDLGDKTVGIGPGMGIDIETKKLLESILKQSKKPMVLDADALNILAQHQHLQKYIPTNSILTPHLKEFERWVGVSNNSQERLEQLRMLAKKLQVYIILKGKFTAIACKDGKVYFNSTGNQGMATGGSGDVLTGILTALLAQQYSAESACKLAVYLHGLAGDIAKNKLGTQALIARDIIHHLSNAWKIISTRSICDK